MSTFLDLAKVFNNFLFQNLSKKAYLSFIVGEYQVGLIRNEVLSLLEAFPNVFTISDKSVSFKCDSPQYDRRTEVFASILRQLKEKNKHLALKSWRDENFEVRTSFSTQPLFEMERAATCMFGIKQFGVAINGYTIFPGDGLCLWIQKRARNKPTWPSKYDNMVSGGLTAGIDPVTCIMKEAKEEASIPDESLKNLVPVGCVSYFYESERGLFPHTEFVYDLELPNNFVPFNEDGEVESFELLPIKDVLDLVKSQNFKTTSCPILLDFLIRHGIINLSNEPELPKLVELLHLPLHNLYNKSCWITSSYFSEEAFSIGNVEQPYGL